MDGSIDRRKIINMPSLIEIKGVGPSLAAACVKKNYRTITKIAAATPKELASVPGITEKSAPLIIASAKSLLPKPSTQKAAAKNKRPRVGPVKVKPKVTLVKLETKTKTKTKTTDKVKGKPDRKISKKPSTKPGTKEKKVSKLDSKDKIKKLKKKIKKLKKKKNKIVKKERKRLKKKKATKSSKK